MLQSGSTDGLNIKTQPKSATANAGEKVSFIVEVTGGKSPYAYQWQYSTDDGETWSSVANSTKYSGVQTATLTVKISITDTATQKLIYRCKISDAAHSTVYADNVIAAYRKPHVGR